MRAQPALAAVATAIVVGGSVLVSDALASQPQTDPPPFTAWQTPAASPPASPEPAPLPAPAEPAQPPALDLTASVSVDVDGFLAWAALDRTSGELVSSGRGTSTTESMVKPWIAADYLRLLDENGDEPSDEELADARAAIRDSDDGAAERLYAAGGHDEVIERMIDMCGLTDTEIHPFWWSRTEITAEDAVRLGECLVNGTAAGPEWTGWVLNEMREVRGSLAEADRQAEDGFEGGRWGLIDGLPQPHRGEVSIKNGWTRIGDTDSWHLNCLALTPEWVLVVLMRYPAGYSVDYGAERCASVARQLFRTPASMAG